MSGDLEAWVQAGLSTEGIDPVDVHTLQNPSSNPQILKYWMYVILDVRQHNGFQSGHIQGSLSIELGELTDHLDSITRELTIFVLCASGMGATISGSILRRDGRDNICVVEIDGALQGVARGYPSATGDE